MAARWNPWLQVLAALCIAASEPVLAYEQGANNLAHQWITDQALAFYRSQFGPSEADTYLGSVQTWENGDNEQIIEGAYDEDVDGENPFAQNAPYLNHFWAFSATDYSRTFDDGLGNSDSGANRAIKLFTGGNGLTAVYDTLYGRAQDAERDRGIVWFYQNDDETNLRKDRAYYWLGEAAHLLQDLTLPCHALNDQHPVVLDQDPVHDWVDGRPFSIASGCAFDDNTATRWQRWRYHAGPKAVGRQGGTAPLEGGAIRSAAQLGGMALQPEWTASVPGGAQAASLPLYHLFLETAGRADDFDSRDVNGQVDQGARRVNRGRYNDWTEQKVNEVADVVVPRAMKATAELLRYFYSRVDATPAEVVIPGLSTDETQPTVIHGTGIIVTASATDATSGVDLDGYRYTLDVRGCCGWNAVGTAGPDLPEVWFTGLADGVYRVRATVENGAGQDGTSSYAYFQIQGTVDVAVQDLLAAATAEGVRLHWRVDPADAASLAGVRVQRAADAEGPWWDLAELPPAADSYLDATVGLRGTRAYRLVLRGRDGTESIAGPVSVSVTASHPVLWPPVVAADGGRVQIRYDLATAGPTRLEVFAVDGRLVSTLATGPHPAGRHERVWNLRGAAGVAVARGVYLVALATSEARLTRKLVLARD